MAVITNDQNAKMLNLIVNDVINIFSFDILIVYVDKLQMVELQNVDNGIYYPI